MRRIFELRSHSPSVTYFVATQPFGGKSTQACFYALYGRSLLFPQNLCESPKKGSLRSRAPATAICNPSPHSIGFRCLRRIFELRSHSPSVTYYVVRSLRVSVGSCPNLHHTISLFGLIHSLRSRAPAVAICNPSPHSVCLYEDGYERT